VRFLKLLYIDREKPNNLIKVEVPTEDGMQATQLSGRGLPEPSCDDHILSGKTVGKNLVGPSAPAASVFRMTHKPPPRVMAEKVSRAISPVNFCIRGTGGNNAGSPSCHPTEFEGPTFLRRLLQGPVDNANLPKTVDAAEDDWLRQEFDARVANNIEKYIAESSSLQNEGGKPDLQGANNIGVRAEAQSDDEEERDAISLRQPVIRVSQRQSVSTGADDAPVNVTAIQAGPTSTTHNMSAACISGLIQKQQMKRFADGLSGKCGGRLGWDSQRNTAFPKEPASHIIRSSLISKPELIRSANSGDRSRTQLPSPGSASDSVLGPETMSALTDYVSVSTARTPERDIPVVGTSSAHRAVALPVPSRCKPSKEPSPSQKHRIKLSGK
jgi:hypothetical protein